MYGPGSRTCTARALALCGGLPDAPEVLDLGCGVGAQTLDLAELTDGAISAVDLHAPNVERLQATISKQGLSQRVSAEIGDFGNMNRTPDSLDLIWSEGALYNIGLRPALEMCRRLLRPGGYMAFTDAVWRTDDPPAEVRCMFEEDYPSMGRVPDVLALLQEYGFSLEGHFTLPGAAWWDDFYTPMEHRIRELREKYKEDREALGVLDEIAAEPVMHKKYGEHYAYEFFVGRLSE